MRTDAAYWIDKLELNVHPEGGFYREIYRSDELYDGSKLPSRFVGNRAYSTSIYFLLRSTDRSVFHRIKSDEIWHFYAGSSLTLYQLDETGLSTQILGSPQTTEGSLQVIVPANTWFGALVNAHDSFVLAGCTVAPGFDFADFEIATRDRLLALYPNEFEIINRLT